MNGFIKKIVVLFTFLIIQTGCVCLDNELLYSSSTFEPLPPHTFEVYKDIEWARPKNHPLLMDIYVPETENEQHPVLVVYHGGGWLINDKSIMNDLSVYIASHSDFIVCNVDYRLLTDCQNTTTMDEIIEDAIGALIWIKVTISSWKGDPSRIAVTGDSAGGHLAAMVVLSGQNHPGDGILNQFPKFKPTYMPEGYSLNDCVKSKLLDVNAAVISYGAFDIKALAQNGLEGSYNVFWEFAGVKPRSIFKDNISVKNSPELYEAVSPSYNIPLPNTVQLPPQLFIAGSKDKTVPPKTVKRYVQKLNKSGHDVLYWEHKNRPHAFLDSGSNSYLNIDFAIDGVPAANVIIHFLKEKMIN